MAQNKTKNKPKILQGIVVGNKMDKSIVVKVEEKFAHPMYGKIVKTHKKYIAHCEDKNVELGDLVTIIEGKPKSSKKTFYFVSKVEV